MQGATRALLHLIYRNLHFQCEAPPSMFRPWIISSDIARTVARADDTIPVPSPTQLRNQTMLHWRVLSFHCSRATRASCRFRLTSWGRKIHTWGALGRLLQNSKKQASLHQRSTHLYPRHMCKTKTVSTQMYHLLKFNTTEKPCLKIIRLT